MRSQYSGELFLPVAHLYMTPSRARSHDLLRAGVCVPYVVQYWHLKEENFDLQVVAMKVAEVALSLLTILGA